MDAQPLMIVKPEDLAEVIKQLTLYWMLLAAACGAAGVTLAQTAQGMARWLRMRGANKPFAQRVEASKAHHQNAAQLHLRCVRALHRRQQRERIAADNPPHPLG